MPLMSVAGFALIDANTLAIGTAVFASMLIIFGFKLVRKVL